MQDLAFTPFDPNWVPLPADSRQRTLWTPEQVQVYDAYTWRNQTRRTPATFAKMTTKTWQDFRHVTYISDLIAKFIRDELLAPNGRPAKRLFLTMPPRHGKSFLLSEHVPAWYLCQYPDRKVILTTYEANFAAKWGGKVRDLIQEHGPKYGISLSANSQAKNRWDLAKPFLGGMLTAGMGGPITGEGGGLLIGDDWVKNSEEANSEAWRETAWDWYNTTFKTRFQKDLSDPDAVQPKMLLLMTRWHDDDPMGRLLQRQTALGGGGDMVVVHLPALAGPADPLGRAEGEALCPEIQTREELLEVKAEDPPSFEALFQGNPTPDEGGLFSKSHFRYWGYATNHQFQTEPGDPARSTEFLTDAYLLRMPEGGAKAIPVKDCRHFITTDLAISEKKRADYTVFSLWAFTPTRDLLLIRRYRDRIEEALHLPTLQAFYDDSTEALRGSPVRLVGVEKATFGLSLIKNARRSSNMPIRELDVDQDKYARAIPAGSLNQGGKLYLPDGVDWTEEFINECCVFPVGAHDDQVDTLAYAAQVCETTFRNFRNAKDARDEAEAQGLGAHAAHIDKIAKRNARIRRKQNNRYAL